MPFAPADHEAGRARFVVDGCNHLLKQRSVARKVRLIRSVVGGLAVGVVLDPRRVPHRCNAMHCSRVGAHDGGAAARRLQGRRLLRLEIRGQPYLVKKKRMAPVGIARPNDVRGVRLLLQSPEIRFERVVRQRQDLGGSIKAPPGNRRNLERAIGLRGALFAILRNFGGPLFLRMQHLDLVLVLVADRIFIFIFIFIFAIVPTLLTASTPSSSPGRWR